MKSMHEHMHATKMHRFVAKCSVQNAEIERFNCANLLAELNGIIEIVFCLLFDSKVFALHFFFVENLMCIFNGIGKKKLSSKWE